MLPKEARQSPLFQPASPHLKREKEQSYISIALGLVFLLVVISITVMESSPKPYNSEQKQRILEAHEAILYFIDAEIMAKRLFPDPSARWSHYILDGGSGCRTHDNTGSLMAPLRYNQIFCRNVCHGRFVLCPVTRPLFLSGLATCNRET